MKTQRDPRHLRRIRLVKSLYAVQFKQKPPLSLNPGDQRLFKQIQRNLEKINLAIDCHSTRFGVAKMTKIDLSILQLGTYELLFEPQIPRKVVLDEAIELAKEFGGEKSPALINAVLAKIGETNLPKENA